MLFGESEGRGAVCPAQDESGQKEDKRCRRWDERGDGKFGREGSDQEKLEALERLRGGRDAV